MLVAYEGLTYCKTWAGYSPAPGAVSQLHKYGTIVLATVHEAVPGARPLWEGVNALPLLTSQEARAKQVFSSAFYR